MAPDVPWRNANGRSLDYPPGEVVDVHRNRPLRVWRAGGAVHEFRQLHVPNRQIRQLDQLCCRAPRLSATRWCDPHRGGREVHNLRAVDPHPEDAITPRRSTGGRVEIRQPMPLTIAPQRIPVRPDGLIGDIWIRE